ncbi:MAG: sigma 54-interacting transcriptional regulator [Syntrophobacteraceae bacterium]|jgi:transcriptional regulator with PAS, ATPase and Fis domain/predicted transcriptional regulator
MPLSSSALNFFAAAGESPERIGRQDKFESILREWEKFIEGDENVDEKLIPQDILDSWIRCRDRGFDPIRIPQQKILTKEEFDILCKENSRLVQICKFFLTYYHDLISFTSFVVSFFDPRGFLIECRIAESFREKARRENWVAGALWNEESAGTSSIGLVVKTKKPSSVIGPQHYLKRSHESTAYAAPIFDPDGIFLGGIVLLCRRDRGNNHAYGMTIAAAHLIENQLKINRSLDEAKAAFVRSEIANSYQRTVMASIPEALIAIDNQGLITLINDQAKKILALDNKPILGQNLRKVLGQESRQVLSLLDNNDHLVYVEIRISSGKTSNDYTLTCNPILSSSGGVIGKILILTEIRRVKKLVANMIGAKANFSFDAICGQNPKFLDTVEQARLASQSRSNVLLLGGSGVGKDVYAQAIHNASERKNAPYVAINCCAIPRDLIASELFGHEEGAFTGSRRGGNQGKFELADGGTIFLDEIGEMPLEMQPILLRVIEDKCVIRIGGAKVRQVDVRIIAATNKDLLDEVYKGNFRKDLYYRLNVFTIRLLPLSERLDDIPLLLDYFVKKCSQTLRKRIDRVDQEVLDFFQRYEWPGNVRELQNVVERMMNCVQTNHLTVDLIPIEMTYQPVGAKPNLEIQSTRDFEKQMITKLMEMNVSKSEIAKRMNINLSTLYRKLNRYDLESRENQPSAWGGNDRSIKAIAAPETSRSESGSERRAEQVQDHVGIMSGLSDDQAQILQSLHTKRGITELMGTVRRANRTKFRNQVLAPLLDAGLVEMTIPDKPQSSRQQYRLTEKGRNLHGILPSNMRKFSASA